ncbi:MAG: ATP-binding protein [Bryobacterales bacterium]|nr:ATP-binding protein [Bryobacterales bacterium]
MAIADHLRRRQERFIREQRAAWEAMELIAAQACAALHEAPKGVLTAGSVREAAAVFEAAGSCVLAPAADRMVLIRPLHLSLDAIEFFDREWQSQEGAEAYQASLTAQALRRMAIDDAMQAVLRLTALKIVEAWRGYLAAERGRHGIDAGSLLNPAKREAERVFERYELWARESLAGPDAGVAGQGRRRRFEDRRQQNLALWRKHRDAVIAAVNLELRLWKTGCELLRASAAEVEELRREGVDLRQDSAALASYLEGWSGEFFDPPPFRARIAGAGQRWASWNARACKAVSGALPENAAFVEAFVFAAQPCAETALRSAAAIHVDMAAGLERACEVVEYALHATPVRPNPLVPEAVSNVLQRLRDEDHAPERAIEALDRSLAKALPEAWYAGLTMVHSGFAAVALWRIRRIQRILLKVVRRGAARRAGRLLAATTNEAEGWWEALLARIGWTPRARLIEDPVVAHPELRPQRTVELPLLYRRLFQPAPVDDIRFLVGRSPQMEGLRRAREAWVAGRPAACLLVGARGSGKTSLLGCAIPEVFKADRVVRAHVRGRLRRAADLHRFLHNALGIPADTNLVNAIRAEKRVIVFEEVERTFLKEFGGFEAITSLIDLVQQTTGTTLWIVVTNLRCFQFLNAAVGLADGFTHRIHTLEVGPDELWRAIEQRHNLSGRKLVFPEPEPRSGWRRVDAQQAFLDTLHEHSRGNFRAAFELWLASVDSTESGILRMRPPEAPQFGQLRRELGQSDHFTLLSVAQHGSLTAAELAAVLAEPETVSRVRMERLQALGVLEPDPDQAGLRICPEVMLLAQNALESENLT